MRAGHGIGEHRGKEEALVDLDAALVFLQARRLGGELGVARQELGESGRGAPAELVRAHKMAPALGYAIVDIDGVRAQIAFARGALGARRRRWERWRHGG